MKIINDEKELRTELRSVPLLFDFVETFLAKVDAINQRHKTQDLNYEIQMAIEEWFVNIVKHGFRGEPNGHVHVQLQYKDGWILIQIIDDGPAFDPHTIPPIEKTSDPEKVKIGGLGFHFIRNFMDSTSYEREDKKNILKMLKRYE